MRRALSSALLAVALGLAACGGSDTAGTTADSTISTTIRSQSPGTEPPGRSAQHGGCDQVAAPAAKRVQLKAPKGGAPAAGTTATVDTSCGSFTIALDTKRAPKTSASFAYLAEQGVFNDTTFHRIAPGFVIQGGDPNGDGSGGPGYSVTEAPAANAQYTKGVVAMAKTATEAPGTSGSQFFVVSGADAGLPPDYAILGRVTKGFSTVKTIEAQGAGPGTDGAPLRPVVIDDVKISKG